MNLLRFLPGLACWLTILSANLQGNTTSWDSSEALRLFRQLSQNYRPLDPPPAGPMLLWSGFGYDPLSPEDIQIIRSLGFNQHLPLEGDHLATAQSLADAGAPLQIMQGLKRFNLPDENGQRTPFPETPKDSFNLSKWRQVAQHIRDTLIRYQDNGLVIQSLWLDYEGYPFSAPYTPSLEVGGQRAATPEAWGDFRRQMAHNIASSYLALPAREVFPSISVLNWVANISYPQTPIINALNQPTPATGPSFFTHSNPYAYGNTLSFELAELPLTLPQRDIDAFYTQLLLRYTSVDSLNRAQSAPYLGSIPWVARVVRDSPNNNLPTMSREAYREALRHLWLRDIDSMLVFNSPALTPDEHRAEIEDVVAVWSEFEAFRKLLADGKALNFAVTNSQSERCLWSGMANTSTAVIRVTPIGDQPAGQISIPIWENVIKLTINADKCSTYKIWRSFGSTNSVMVTVVDTSFIRN
ncbi:hypothetical protein [Cerasicoccus fimbriatus]|uniref:hypothetical protein n=1 Tax=Cerasicoccus fimbriatus TaxID=3014554 RepID=UPI0022B34E9D|nr:hypothetical protein [Cerasicoccus sp. TK19100]